MYLKDFDVRFQVNEEFSKISFRYKTLTVIDTTLIHGELNGMDMHSSFYQPMEYMLLLLFLWLPFKPKQYVFSA